MRFTLTRVAKQPGIRPLIEATPGSRAAVMLKPNGRQSEGLTRTNAQKTDACDVQFPTGRLVSRFAAIHGMLGSADAIRYRFGDQRLTLRRRTTASEISVQIGHAK